MNPIPSVPRHKAGEHLGWASLAPEPEDKENCVLALAPVGKRHQEHGLDSILQEQNSKGKQRRTLAKAGKAPEEAPGSKPSFNNNKEFKANLAAKLEVEGDEEFNANLATELKADNDLGDEEYIPSPDDIEDDVGDDSNGPKRPIV